MYTALLGSPTKPSGRHNYKAGIIVPWQRALGVPRTHSWDCGPSEAALSPALVTIIEGRAETGLLTWGERTEERLEVGL